MPAPDPTLRDRLVAASGAEWRTALADSDPAVRRTALLSASRRATSADLAHLLETALGDADASVRREAAEAAGRHPAAARLLRGSLERVLTLDEDTHCREAAAFALGESTDGSAAAGLVAALGDEASPLVREAIAGALGALGQPGTVGAVVGLTRGEKPSVRRRAVIALAAFDDPAADSALEAAAGDRDRYVREAAEWLLRDDDDPTPW